MKAGALVVSAVMLLMVAGIALFVPVIAAGAAAVACTVETPDLTAPGQQGERGNAEYIWAALLDDGVTPEAAAGVLGNLHQETGGSFDPRTVQSNGVGHGIAQWSAGDRWDQLVSWAHRAGRDEWSLQTQVTWMLKEMHQGWGSFSMARFTTMTDVLEATIYFHDRFEGSADSDAFVKAGRGGYAREWYSRLNGTVPAPLTPSVGSVWVIGDSLTSGSERHIETAYLQRGQAVSIVAGQNWRAADAVARADSPAARQARAWVVALGTNDTPEQLRETGRALLRKAGDRQVAWINVARPEDQDRVNGVLSQLAEQHAGMRVVDFAALASARPDSFDPDGVHMTSAGYRWRAQLYVVGGTASGTVSFDPADCVGGSGGSMTCPTAPDRVLPQAVRTHMKPNALAVADCVVAGWPEIRDLSPSYRPSDPYPDHPSGQAVDIMMPQGCADTDGRRELGGQIVAFLVKYADEYRIKYLIWRQRIWTIQDGPQPWSQWRGMSDRGSCTANHEDHVHVSTDQVGGDRGLGGFTYDYKTPDDGTRPCPPRVECGSVSAGGSWALPTKSGDWRSERRNPGNDPGNQRGAPNDHGRCHAGWDISSPSGQRIVAPAAGRASTGYEAGGAGNYVTLDHGGGVTSLYMHMTRFADAVNGRQVQAGQVIGYVGSTGHSSGPHLHFEVRVGGVAKDPRHWVLAGFDLVDAC